MEYVSKKLGKRTILVKNSSKSKGGRGSTSEGINSKGRDLMSPDEIARMDNKNCILFIRGLFPFFCTKYDYPKHKNYGLTGDADDSQLYDYRHPERFAIPEEKKKVPRTRTNIRKNSVKHENGPRRTTQIREKSQAGFNNMEIKALTTDTLKEIGFTENVEETLNNITIVEVFRADHEFYAADDFNSSFLDEEIKEEKKEELIEDNNFSSEFDLPEEFDEPTEDDY